MHIGPAPRARSNRMSGARNTSPMPSGASIIWSPIWVAAGHKFIKGTASFIASRDNESWN